MTFITQLGSIAVDKFWTPTYTRSRKSAVQKQHSGSNSLVPVVPESRQDKEAMVVFTLPSQKYMVKEGCAVELLLAAPQEDEPSSTLQPWTRLYQTTAYIIPSLPGDCTVDSAHDKTTYSGLICPSLASESPEWQQGLHEHKWL